MLKSVFNTGSILCSGFATSRIGSAMGKLKKAFLIFLTLATTGFAQPKWTWQNPSPQGNYLTSIWSIDSITTLAVGYVGAVIVTTDGGDSWQVKSLNDEFNLYDLSFTPDKVGWCVGVGGAIYKTEDFGKSWIKKNSDSLSILHSVFFLSPQRGWAVGYYGQVARTTDGGNSWTSANFGPDLFLSVYFISDSVGWIAAKTGILKTVDGGVTWTKVVEASPTISSKSIVFTDSLRGWVICSYGRVMTTVNGGASWTSLILDSTATLSSIQFVDNKTGWISGSTLYKTTDGGNSWIGIKDSAFLTAKSIQFLDNKYGWIAGDKGLLLKTTDGGQSWKSISRGITNWIYCVDFVSEQVGWAAGTDVVLKTTNGGSVWKMVATPSGAISGVDFLDEKNGWIVGSDGLIEHSSDGGISWMNQTSPRTVWLNAIHFLNPLRGIAVGDGGAIVVTTNGGLNWTSVESHTTNQLTSLSFVNDSVGWVCGYNGIVLKTTNGGTDWQSSMISGLSATLPLCIQFVDCLHGWVSDGIYRKFYRTIDGGATWLSTPVQYYWPSDIFSAESFFFFDSLNGIAGGFAGGTVFRTSDGGKTWSVESRVILNRITAFCFVTPECGWLVGRDGAILKFVGSSTEVQNPFLEANSILSHDFDLYQNYPNPLNPSTTIKYQILQPSYVTLKVFDILGREVTTLINEIQNAGEHSIHFDGTHLSSGIYLYQLRAGIYRAVKKMVLLK